MGAPRLDTSAERECCSIETSRAPASFRRIAMPGVVYRDLAGPERNALLAAARHRDDLAPAAKAFMRVLRRTLERGDWNAAP
jgi:hypothetical protein